VRVSASVEVRFDWGYGRALPRVRALYEQAKELQWNASTAVDWSIEVPFGEALPADSAPGLRSFAGSPLARFGRPTWDRFRWEFHSWLASQFAHGEQGAVVASARLAEVLPTAEAKCFAASQVADEARHVEAFSRYVREKMPEPYPIAEPLAAMLHDLLGDARWDMTALGLQIILEGLAMAALRLANSTLHDELIRDITRLAARDEARHIAFGIISLREHCPRLTAAERREREDVVLQSAALMRDWFLLADVWERVGISRAEGIAFAAADETMVSYRQAVFSRAAAALTRIGLMSDRLARGLAELDLVRG
jgi:P-aminobenzoate N-oxygenase AurF